MSQRCALYLRQSLDKDGTELGIERQESECQRLAQNRGFEVVHVIRDNNRSASVGDRPGYLKLLDLIERREIDVVVVLRLDRLLRRPVELEWLIDLCERTGVSVVTVDGLVDLTSSAGRQVARLQAAFAKWEVEVKSERHKLANLQKARAGKPHGSRRPYAYLSDLVTVYEPEAEILRQMAQRLIDGHSYKEIAHWLNKNGHTTTMGKPWLGITVRNMLRKERYGGIRIYNGERFLGQWEPVFDQRTWERLKLAIKLRAAKDINAPRSRKYLLTGLAHCGACGARLNGSTKIDRPGRPKRRVYNCVECRGVARNADALDWFIRECVIYRLDSPQMAQALSNSSDNTDDQKALDDLLLRRSTQSMRVEDIINDYASGDLNKEEYTRAKRVADATLAEIDKQIAKLKRDAVNISISAGDTIRDAWNRTESTEWRRTIISMLVDKIVVNPGIGKPVVDVDGKKMRFDASLIEIAWRV